MVRGLDLLSAFWRHLSSRLIKRFDPLMTAVEADLIQRQRHVDFSMFGAVPLEIYVETKEQKYLDMGKFVSDRQWENPTPEGLTSETRFWIDDMYMITAVQVLAFRATGDSKYLDRAALEMVTYLDKLAAGERFVLSRSGCAVLLGAGQRLGSCGNDGVAACTA